MVDVPEDVTVEQYFTGYVPSIFKEQVGSGVLGMEGTEIGVQFDIGDAEKKTYSLVVKDAKELEVKEGAVSDPLIRLEMSEEVFKSAVTGRLGGVTDVFTDMSQMTKARYEQIKGVKGTLRLDLATDGAQAAISIVFNGGESPESTFVCAVEDWVAISKGELAGPTAFMSGKLKIQGDMAFAMGLAALTG